MFFVAIQPEMPATTGGNLSRSADHLSALTATQFAAHAATNQFARAGWYAACDTSNWVAIN